MRILVACEFSGIVREAFNSMHGNYAISCDLLPPEDGRTDYHYQGDVRDIIRDGWDLMIAHPPCTFLCNSGVRWLWKKDVGYGSHGMGTFKDVFRWEDMKSAARFFRLLLNAPIPRICIENPIPHKYAVEIIGEQYDQIIQPWQFGHGEQKATCLWLKNLPKLTPTNIVNGREQRVWKLPPSENRWAERSRTYPGIAMAMAEQWSIA